MTSYTLRKRFIFCCVVTALALGRTQPASAVVNVFACEPEWAALVRELGGPDVSVYEATTARQDPHRIEARPSLIARARNADLTVCTGAELEVGWLPMVLRQAANPKIGEGTPGAFEATRYVRLLDVPQHLDRADGDIHAAGNPHIQTAPDTIFAVAGPLAARLAKIDPGHAQGYEQRYDAFASKWQAAMAGWRQRGKPLLGAPVAVQHNNWSYLIRWLGLRMVATLEPKPGVPPTSGYLAEVLETIRQQPIRMVIRAAYEGDRPARFLSERARVPIAVLPFTLGGTPEAGDLFSMFDDSLNRLLAAYDAGRS